MTTNSEFQTQYHADEIDLVDIWLALQRYRLLFAGVVVAVMLLGIAAALLLPTRYEYRLTLEIGGTESAQGAADNEFSYVESVATAEARIRESIAPEVAARLQSEHPDAGFLDGFELNRPEDTGMLRLALTAQADQASVAKEFLSSVANTLLNSQNEVLNRRVDLLRKHTTQRLNEIDEQFAELRGIRQQLAQEGASDGNGIVDTSNQSSAATGLASLLFTQQVRDLTVQRERLEKQLALELAVNVRQSRVISGPVRNPKPEPPGPLLVAALSVFAGIFVAAVAVLLAVLKEQADVRYQSSLLQPESGDFQEERLHRYRAAS